MVPEKDLPSHPGEILIEKFLKPMRISSIALANHTGVSLQRIGEIVRRKRGMTADVAWRLAQAFGTTPEYWMNLQTAYDLARSKPAKKVERIWRLEDEILKMIKQSPRK